MAQMYKILRVMKLCEDALSSCSDNYGSEAHECGEGFEQYHDDELVHKALKEVRRFIEKNEKK